MKRRKFAKLISMLPFALSVGCYSSQDGCHKVQKEQEEESWQGVIYRPGCRKAFHGGLRDVRKGDAFAIASSWHPCRGFWFLAFSDPFVNTDGVLAVRVEELLRPDEYQSEAS